MIQSKSPTILHINKLSVLLVCLLLLLFWAKYTLTNNNHQALVNHNNNIKQSKYITITPLNPFLKTHDDITTKDELPTVTALQATIPPFSSLNLRLHGIVFQNKRNSYAMVSMHGAIQEIVSVNDQISEGLYVNKIARRQIEVDYFGEKFIVNLMNRVHITESAESDSFIDNALRSRDFSQYIDYLEVDKKRNPIRLFMIRRPYPVYSGGKFQGYKIMPGSNADQFKRLGFKSGDIITYLNGTEFTGPGQKEFVIQQLTHAENIDLTVIRNKQQLNIIYGF